MAGALSAPLNGTFVAQSGPAEERGSDSFTTKRFEKHNVHRNQHQNTAKMTLDQTLLDGVKVTIRSILNTGYQPFRMGQKRPPAPSDQPLKVS